MIAEGLLREHQRAGAQWLAQHPKGYLADAPRVGKTRTFLAGLAEAGAERPLIVCPAIVRTHWQREAAALGLGDPTVLSYDACVRGGPEYLAKLVRSHDALGLDEAHYLKHAEAKRTQLLLGKGGLARQFARVHPLSGTPMPRHPGEMWTVLSALYPEVVLARGFRTQEQFLEHFTVRVPQRVRVGNRWVDKMKVVGVKNMADLREMLAPVFLRRTLEDVSTDVPALDWQVLPLDESHKRFTDPATAQKVEEALAAGNLEAIAGDPYVARMRRRLGELKAVAMVELVKDALENGEEQVVLLAHHREVLETLRAGLLDYGVSYIDGDVPDRHRALEIDWFQQGDHRVFIGQTIACQTGITLSAARVCYLVEPDWTAVVNEQAGNRIMDTASAGVKRVVQMVALAGTLDEAIVRQNQREVRQVQELWS